MAQDSIRTIIARIEERQISISDNIGDMKKNFEAHIIQDAKEFSSIRQEISSMNKYAASIAIVSSFISASVTAIIMGWKSIKEFIA